MGDGFDMMVDPSRKRVFDRDFRRVLSSGRAAGGLGHSPLSLIGSRWHDGVLDAESPTHTMRGG